MLIEETGYRIYVLNLKIPHKSKSLLKIRMCIPLANLNIKY